MKGIDLTAPLVSGFGGKGKMKGLVISAFVLSLVSLALSTATYIQVGGVSQIKSRMEDLGLEMRDLREETARRLELKTLLFEAIETLSRAGDLIRWSEDYSEATSCLETAEAILSQAQKTARGAERARIEEMKQDVEKVAEAVGREERSAANGLQRLLIKLRLLRDNL